MFLVPQGKDQTRRIDELERRIVALENLIKGLQSEPKRPGRPPKDKHGTNLSESRSPSGD